jgi:hypothetical protein
MPINVISAVYAGPNAGLDVTQVCQGIVDPGNDDIAVNNDTFTDPDVGTTKRFTIAYTTSPGAAAIYRGASEGDTLDLVP